MKTTDSNVQIVAMASEIAEGKNGFIVKVTGLDNKLNCERKFQDPLKAMRYMFLLHKKMDLQINKLDLTAVSVAYNKAKAEMLKAKAEMDSIANSANEMAEELKEEVKPQQLDLFSENTEPWEQQWHDLKKKHPDALLLFRCGDFYETYYDDATQASEILGITKTVRKNSNVYQAGFPYHALDSYLPKLIRAGKRVAICDKIENTKKASK